MKDLETIALATLEHTEANGLVVGASPENGMVWCLPIWECENEEDARALAIQMAITWADKNGCGDIQVTWVYKAMETQHDQT